MLRYTVLVVCNKAGFDINTGVFMVEFFLLFFRWFTVSKFSGIICSIVDWLIQFSSVNLGLRASITISSACATVGLLDAFVFGRIAGRNAAQTSLIDTMR